MTHTKKRLLAMLLAVVLCFSALPFSVSADEFSSEFSTESTVETQPEEYQAEDPTPSGGEILGQHRTIAEASAVESPIRQETIGFPAHFFARAHNFKPPGRACQPEADSPMRT